MSLASARAVASEAETVTLGIMCWDTPFQNTPCAKFLFGGTVLLYANFSDRAADFAKYTKQNWMFPIFDLSPCLDFWTCGKRSQTHYKMSILRFRKIVIFEKCRDCRLIIDSFTGFKVPPSCASVSQLPAALRRPQKKHALEFWSMYLVDFVDFCRF